MIGAFSANRKAEYNAYVDEQATRVFFDLWPTEIWVSGYEVGLSITYPATSIEHDFGYVANHPVAEAYRLYIKMPYDRPTWDLNAVLHAVRPDRGYFGLSDPGTISLTKENISVHTPHENGKHRYQTVTPEQRIQVKELFVQLVSSPPGK
jgi:inosine-uridine nucleoside N-ribohydrolase